MALLGDLPGATLAGLDLGIGLPFADAGAFFPDWDASPADARGLWALIDRICAMIRTLRRVASSPTRKPRAISATARIIKATFSCCRARQPAKDGFRVAETAQRAQGVRPVSNFNLVGAAQVGKSSLTGMRMLHRLGTAVPVWPIDPLPETGSVVVEIYTSVAARLGGVTGAATKIRVTRRSTPALDALDSPPVSGAGMIDDHSSDALITSQHGCAASMPAAICGTHPASLPKSPAPKAGLSARSVAWGAATVGRLSSVGRAPDL